jgi:replicative DNA helicase
MQILYPFIPSEYYKIDEWDDDEASPTAGQAEIMIAKHRNGSIENVRLKFIGHLGKFDNLEDHSGNYDDLPSSMNQDDNPFQTKSLPSAHEAFGSNLDDDDDSDMPFRNYQKPIFYRLFYSYCLFFYLVFENNSDLL